MKRTNEGVWPAVGFAVVAPGARRVHPRQLPPVGPLLLCWAGVLANDLTQAGMWRREVARLRAMAAREVGVPDGVRDTLARREREAREAAHEWLRVARDTRERAMRRERAS